MTLGTKRLCGFCTREPVRGVRYNPRPRDTAADLRRDSISYQMAISMYYLLGLGKDKPPSQWRTVVEPGPMV